MWRIPLSSALVDMTAKSSELKAERKSPLVAVAMKSRASASISTSNSKPRSLSDNAVWRACLISSVDKGSNSKICTRERMAGVTEKNGFSVVAPIMMILPFSSKGSKKSCLVLSKR